VTEQVEVVEPGVNVHGPPEKPPVPLVENDAVPAGADFVPESVSETTTVQVVLPFTGIDDGEQPVTCVEVERVVTVTSFVPELVAWVPSPP
jgi:hypothetical protein